MTFWVVLQCFLLSELICIIQSLLCRMRKIEKIQTLDQQTAKLKAENEDLAKFANKLKDQVTKA